MFNGPIEYILLTTIPYILSGILAIVLWRTKHQLKKLQVDLALEREINEVNRGRATSDGFYDNVLEADITNNKLLGKNASSLIQLLGLPPDASFSNCIDAILDRLIKPAYREQYRDNFDCERLIQRYHAGEKQFTFEFEECADLIHYYWTRVTVCIYYSETSKAVKIISYVKNIQKEKEKEINLQKEASTDYLTGLLNKRAAEPHIHNILHDNRMKDQCHALMIIDIDCFKQVNDTVGHAGGDAILQMIARLLLHQMDSHDIVSRIGGDEFLIFMKNCKCPESAGKKAAQLTRLATALDTSSYDNISLSLSIGIAIYPDHADHYTDLFNMADKALYCVKRSGRNGYRIYGEDKSD